MARKLVIQLTDELERKLMAQAEQLNQAPENNCLDIQVNQVKLGRVGFNKFATGSNSIAH